MPKLRTDDQVRRLRALWLGPPGCRWPFDATYVEWMLGAVLTLATGIVLWAFTTITLGFPYNYLVTIPGAPSIGGMLAWLIRPHIEPNKPLGYWRNGIKTEMSGMRAAVPLTAKLPAPCVTRPVSNSKGNSA